jgi:hypothetical protein
MFKPATRFEYRWIGQNSGFPLLQLNTELHDSIEVPVALFYQDSIRKNSIAHISNKPLIISIYPNPFLQTTTIEYLVEHFSFVSIELIDLSGKIVSVIHSGYVNPGKYYIPLNLTNNFSSVYFIKFRLDNQVHFEKISNIR